MSKGKKIFCNIDIWSKIIIPIISVVLTIAAILIGFNDFKTQLETNKNKDLYNRIEDKYLEFIEVLVELKNNPYNIENLKSYYVISNKVKLYSKSRIRSDIKDLSELLFSYFDIKFEIDDEDNEFSIKNHDKLFENLRNHDKSDVDINCFENKLQNTYTNMNSKENTEVYKEVNECLNTILRSFEDKITTYINNIISKIQNFSYDIAVKGNIEKLYEDSNDNSNSAIIYNDFLAKRKQHENYYEHLKFKLNNELETYEDARKEVGEKIKSGIKSLDNPADLKDYLEKNLNLVDKEKESESKTSENELETFDYKILTEDWKNLKDNTTLETFEPLIKEVTTQKRTKINDTLKSILFLYMIESLYSGNREDLYYNFEEYITGAGSRGSSSEDLPESFTNIIGEINDTNMIDCIEDKNCDLGSVID